MFCSSIMLEETGYDSWRKIENEKKKSKTKTNKKSGLAGLSLKKLAKTVTRSLTGFITVALYL